MTTVERSENNPLIEVSDLTGDNVNYPSVIKVPDWVDDPLGEYYMYFSHKRGQYIRLAYADAIDGPWEIHPPGTLHIKNTPFTGHIASPDVHVDHDAQVIRMYYHGETRARDLLRNPWRNEQYRYDRYGFRKREIPYRILFNAGRMVYKTIGQRRSYKGTSDASSDTTQNSEVGNETARKSGFEQRLWDLNLIPSPIQETRHAVSTDGLVFTSSSPILGPSWFAVFTYPDRHFALGRDGYVYAADSPTSPFTRTRKLFDRHRHFGVHVVGDLLDVYYSRSTDEPEGILRTAIKIEGMVDNWKMLSTEYILSPEMKYEGADIDIEQTNKRGPENKRRELRDPEIYAENEQMCLFYALKGESGIGLAKIVQ